MARPHVPKFGNWENDDSVPYTVYFDKARKGRGGGGKMINPNDPRENPDMFPGMAPSTPGPAPPTKTRAPTEEPLGRGAIRPMPHERKVSREEQFADSPVRRAAYDPPNQQRYGGRGSNSGRPARQSAGSDYSIEKSPLHPQQHYQAKLSGRGNASPAWEGKNSYDSTHNSSHGGAGRSRKPRGDESPDRGAAVPRFGEWDVSNPQGADNYTHIFNKVREERHAGPPNVGGIGHQSPYRPQKQNTEQNQKFCCFPWGGK